MNAISCAGSVDNLIVLDPEKYKSTVFEVAKASDISMLGQYKWKVGELEFESLMRMLDNLVSPHPSDPSEHKHRQEKEAWLNELSFTDSLQFLCLLKRGP